MAHGGRSPGSSCHEHPQRGHGLQLVQPGAGTSCRRASAAPTGTEGSVGLVGATLGGGFGLLTRRFGMACDNLLAAEIVIAPADGGAEPIAVDEQHHPDLLWALRGAGNGTFGIVTSLTFRVHPLTQTVHVVATWPGLEDLAAVFDAWQRHAPHGNDRLTSQQVALDEIAASARQGLLALAVGAGLQVMQALMADDVTAVCGPKGRRPAAHRHPSWS